MQAVTPNGDSKNLDITIKAALRKASFEMTTDSPEYAGFTVHRWVGLTQPSPQLQLPNETHCHRGPPSY